MLTNRKISLHAWGQILRIPNLLTVPGDPIAGFFLAQTVTNTNLSAKKLFLIIPASIFLYAFGLLTNDYFDFKEDLLKRPERPIPSGKLKMETVLITGIVFALIGYFFCFLINKQVALLSILLVILILVYNIEGKRIPILGPINMGLCRGLNFLLGTACVIPNLNTNIPSYIRIAGLTIILYIASVTELAKYETSSVRKFGVKRWFPFIILIICFMIFYKIFDNISITGTIVSILIFIMAVISIWNSSHKIKDIPMSFTISNSIGIFIHSLMFIQASFIAITGYKGIVLSLVLLLMWVLARKLTKNYYAS